MITLENKTHQVIIPIKSWTFPAGERGITTDPVYVHSSRDELKLTMQFRGSDDVVDMMLARDLYPDNPMTLEVRYMPFSRQDRKVTENDVHALKAFAKLVNSMNFHRVITWDPHSDVVEALFDRLIIRRQWDIALEYIPHYHALAEIDYIIAPDIGAAKKTEKFAELVGKPMLQSIKKRCPETGNLLRFEILDCPDLNEKHVLVLDDICDGGGTFNLLAKELHEECQRTLFVTHGIFSKGKHELYQNYDCIIAANDLFVPRGVQ